MNASTMKNKTGAEDPQTSSQREKPSSLVVALAMGSVAFAIGAIVKLCISSDEYGGMDSLVSYSSRMIAGGSSY